MDATWTKKAGILTYQNPKSKAVTGREEPPTVVGAKLLVDHLSEWWTAVLDSGGNYRTHCANAFVLTLSSTVRRYLSKNPSSEPARLDRHTRHIVAYSSFPFPILRHTTVERTGFAMVLK
jgi:hypothetical protein